MAAPVPEGFDAWAIVEVMGHKKYAGRVQEHVVAGHGFVRVDVPEFDADGQKVDGFSKLIGPGSIYAMTPVSEQVARAVAMQLRERPVHPWEMPKPALPAPNPDAECRGCGRTMRLCMCINEVVEEDDAPADLAPGESIGATIHVARGLLVDWDIEAEEHEHEDFKSLAPPDAIAQGWWDEGYRCGVLSARVDLAELVGVPGEIEDGGA